MSLAQHLLELRKRLFIGASSILVAAVAGWYLSQWVIDALRSPIEQIAKQQHRLAQLNYDTIAGEFDLKLQIAVMVGVLIASPVWLYQIWAFFVPGLTRRELKYGLGFFLTAVPLFLAGCLAGWLVFPHIVELLSSFGSSEDAKLLPAKTYFDFVLKLVLAVGIAFVLPVFLVLLDFVGVVSGKAILKAWRVAVLAILVFTAIATPSADVISMFLLAVPIILLYFAAVGVAFLHDRRALARAARIEDELTASGS